MQDAYIYACLNEFMYMSIHMFVHTCWSFIYVPLNIPVHAQIFFWISIFPIYQICAQTFKCEEVGIVCVSFLCRADSTKLIHIINYSYNIFFGLLLLTAFINIKFHVFQIRKDPLTVFLF